MIYFLYPIAALLAVPLCFIILYYLKPRGTRNVLRVALKLIIASIILLSIASPYTVVEHQGSTGSTDITIIADNTGSMRVFNATTPYEVYNYLFNRTSVNIDFMNGTESSIGDHIITSIRPGSSILLISDGNNNFGRSLPEAINFARNLNATVYLLKQEPVRKDLGVSISSDTLGVMDAPVEFNMDVSDVGGLEGDLEVRVDNTVVHASHVSRSMRIPVTYRFNSQGSHTIRAEIFTTNEDAIPQNNVFYRSVHVIPAPRILLVSHGSSPLSRVLGQLYSVDVSTNLTDPAPYKAVVLDDISAGELSVTDSIRLSDHIAGGGGLVVVGGSKAYADYSARPVFEQMLPVKTGGIPHTGKGAGVVFIVDISGSTGDLSGADPKLGIEKGLALQMLDGIGTDDYLGVVAFNNAPHEIVPFARYPDRTNIKDTVARLKYGGTTHLSPALFTAHNMLKNFDGGRNVILISDGNVADGETSLKAAGEMANDGITVYAIGVGGDTDVEFMKKIAAAGGGGYLRRDDSHGIELLFGEVENKKKREGFPLLIINSGHFITKDLTLNASVIGYNNVFTKQNAQSLIMTGNGDPVLSTWRFGLGRVVSIAVDNGNNWAQALYNEDNSKVISTSVNYAIGSPAGMEIQALDGEIYDPIEVRVYSDSEPDIRFDGKKIQVRKTGEMFYGADVVPDSTGIHDLSGYTIAVNQPSEYREPGNNAILSDIITSAGGRVYSMSEIGSLIPDIKSKNTGMVREMVDLKPLFIFAALMMYSIEVIIRRLAEIFR